MFDLGFEDVDVEGFFLDHAGHFLDCVGDGFDGGFFGSGVFVLGGFE